MAKMITALKDDNGLFHSHTEPAMAFDNGWEQWLVHGVLHREGGPAITYPDGSQQWFKHGRLHREDGPAVVGAYEYQSWWVEGQRVTEAEYKEMSFYSEVINPDGTITIVWRDWNGDPHRHGFPAMIHAPHSDDGELIWYQHGVLHREDGPAIEYKWGKKMWIRHGLLSRIDGPAIEWSDGVKDWRGPEGGRVKPHLLKEFIVSAILLTISACVDAANQNPIEAIEESVECEESFQPVDNPVFAYLDKLVV